MVNYITLSCELAQYFISIGNGMKILGELLVKGVVPWGVLGNGSKAGAGVLCVHPFHQDSPSVPCGATVSLFLWGSGNKEFWPIAIFFFGFQTVIRLFLICKVKFLTYFTHIKPEWLFLKDGIWENSVCGELFLLWLSCQTAVNCSWHPVGPLSELLEGRNEVRKPE